MYSSWHNFSFCPLWSRGSRWSLVRFKCANSAWICGACDASPGPYSLFIVVSSPLLNFLARLTPLKTLNSGGTCSLLVPHPSDATEDAKLRCSPPWFLSFFPHPLHPSWSLAHTRTGSSNPEMCVSGHPRTRQSARGVEARPRASFSVPSRMMPRCAWCGSRPLCG